MNCEICNKGPREGVTVYRVNPKGQQGIWRCPAHLTSEQADGIHPETIQVVRLIESAAIDSARSAAKEAT